MPKIGKRPELRKVMEDGIKMNEVYNIKHCIWCGKTGFKDSQEVIEHIKIKHTGQS